ncbi:PLP-dependent aminotransferase family protein [Paenibacillus hamazuiensis]|uniref:MocR-like pyridoxine biosynthesis transcription factor PdxR n=1 Tax=Paenibacillus hamazuiensis TaxID=2936508 RepID=UPI00200FC59F|nr:PLP-dependent aminotransferase family protein [Paenibacillus hamazuiensis]
MFDILLSNQTDQPLYMQLYTQIRDHIRSGIIANGMRLPSVRSLQLHLNISKTPIETAYQMLSAEGYIVSKPRSGIYAVKPYETNRPLYSSGDSEYRSANLRSSARVPEETEWFIDFNPSGVDSGIFPVRVWKKMIHDALDRHSSEMRDYGDKQGEYALRAVLAEYLRNARGVVCSPEQIVVGAGISYSIGLLAKLLAGIGEVAIEEPGFRTVREQLIAGGFRVIPIPVHDKGISLDQLRSCEANAVYVTPSHQFPTGSVMPYAEREMLLGWANSRNGYIIEDDYDGEFRYYGKPIPSLQSLDDRGRVIYIGTFSKAFTPALRMNYMVLPHELAGRLGEMQRLLLNPSRIDQWAMQAFIEQGHWYRHIRKMRGIYRKKHQKIIELLQAHFADSIEITGQSAGLHIQATVRTERTCEELVNAAAAERVRIYDFREMRMSPISEGKPKVYLGFGGLSENELETGINLLKKAWSGMID